MLVWLTNLVKAISFSTHTTIYIFYPLFYCNMAECWWLTGKSFVFISFPRAVWQTVQRAGVKAQSKGGIPVAHLPPGGSAVCRAPWHPRQDAGEGCHHCEWGLALWYCCCNCLDWQNINLYSEYVFRASCFVFFPLFLKLCPLIRLTGYLGLEKCADFLLLASSSPPLGAGGEVWDPAGQQGPQWRPHAVHAATLVCWNRRNSQGMTFRD